MSNLYGSIDLAQLGEIIRKQPNLVKVVEGKDGKKHKYLDVYVNERKEASQFGKTHYLKVAVKKDDAQEDVNYYVGDFQVNEPKEREATSEDVKDMPF